METINQFLEMLCHIGVLALLYKIFTNNTNIKTSRTTYKKSKNKANNDIQLDIPMTRTQNTYKSPEIPPEITAPNLVSPPRPAGGFGRQV